MSNEMNAMSRVARKLMGFSTANDGGKAKGAGGGGGGGGAVGAKGELLEALEPRVLMNAAPVLDALDPANEVEGESIYIWAEFTDSDYDDTHTATVDWGDGVVESLSVYAQYYDPYDTYIYEYDYYTYEYTGYYIGYFYPGSIEGDHAFADDGTYTVTVTLNDDAGGSSSRQFTATIGNVAPTVGVSGAGTGETGAVYTLNLSSSDPGADTISQWDIDWGDGNQEVVVGNPSTADHVYGVAGAMTISATATDEDGTYGAGSVGVTVAVGNVAPVLGTLTDVSVDEGGTLNWSGTFSDVDGADTHNAVVDWGDGSATEAVVVDSVAGTISGSHVYADNGVYTLGVTLTDNGGGSDSGSLSVTVNAVAPVLAVSGASDGAVGLNYVLNLSVTDPGADTVSQWDINWGDGNSEVVVGNPSTAGHVYASGGSYVINASATDEDGTYAAAGVNVEVTWGPMLGALGDESLDEGSVLDLAGTFTDADNPPDTHTAVVDWGDGSAVEGLAVSGGTVSGSHVYVDDGVFVVSVTVTDSRGLSDTGTMTATVGNVAPVVSVSGAAFTERGVTYVLHLSGVGDPGADTISQWDIDWGDGNSEVVVGNPSTVTHQFGASATRTIVATATDEDGTYAAGSVVVAVVAFPEWNDPQLSDVAISEGEWVTIWPEFSDRDTDAGHTVTVDWGDGSAVEAVYVYDQYYDAYYYYDYDPYTMEGSFDGKMLPGYIYVEHDFYDDGLYTVAVTVEDGTGGADTSYFTVTVNNVIPSLSATGPAVLEEDAPYPLFLGYSDPGEETLTWSVDWGDGSGVEAVAGDAGYAEHFYPAGFGGGTISMSASDEDGAYAVPSITFDAAPAKPVGLVGTMVSESSIQLDWLESSYLAEELRVERSLNGVFFTEIATLAAGVETYTAGGLSAATGYTFRVRSARDVAGSDLFSAYSNEVVAVTDTLVHISGAETVDEGAVYTLSLNDEGRTLDGWTIDWGDGSGLEAVGGGALTATHSYVDGSNDYVISASATEGAATHVGGTLEVGVGNVAPVVTVGGLGTYFVGAAYGINLSVSDVGVDALTSWSVNWGDGSAIEVMDGAVLTASHTYVAGDVDYDISVVAVDEDGSYQAPTLTVVEDEASASAQSASSEPTVGGGGNGGGNGGGPGGGNGGGGGVVAKASSATETLGDFNEAEASKREFVDVGLDAWVVEVWPIGGAADWGVYEEGGSVDGHAYQVGNTGNDVVLDGGDSFVGGLVWDLSLPDHVAHGNSSLLLRFMVEVEFDGLGDGGAMMRDAFEAALLSVDGEPVFTTRGGAPWLTPFEEGRDGFLNVTENGEEGGVGEVSRVTSPVSGSVTVADVEGYANRMSVDVDVTELALENVRLVLRLINNNEDGESRLRVVGLEEATQTAPVLAVTSFGPNPVAEGSVVSLVATVNDAEFADVLTVTVDWGDQTQSVEVVDRNEVTGEGQKSFSHVYADNGTYKVEVFANDGLGLSAISHVEQVVVDNVAPELDAAISFELVDVNGTPTVTVNARGAFSDPGFTPVVDNGARETMTVTIDWGDGSTVTLEHDDLDAFVNGGIDADKNAYVTTGAFNVDHVYREDKHYTVTVTVSDDDNELDVATASYGFQLITIDVVRQINLKSNGVVPVKIFSRNGFNLNAIDVSTLRFGPGGAVELDGAASGGNKFKVVQFATQDSGIDPDDTYAYLTGYLNDGTYFVGVDEIRVVPGSSQGRNAVVGDDVPSKFYFVDANANATRQISVDGDETGYVPYDDYQTAPVGVTVNADGSVHWSLDASGRVLVLDGAGATLGAWQMNGVDTAGGIATDGASLFVLDIGSNEVHRFYGAVDKRTGSAEASDVFGLNVGNDDAMDLTTDGETIWVVDQADGLLYLYDLSGADLGQVSLDARYSDAVGVGHAAGSKDLWVVDGASSALVYYAGATEVSSGTLEADGEVGLDASVAPVGLSLAGEVDGGGEAGVFIAPDDGRYTDISDLFGFEHGRTAFERDRGHVFTDLEVTAVDKAGVVGHRDRLLLAIANLSVPSVELVHPDGYTEAGYPYYDVTDLVGRDVDGLIVDVAGSLDPFEVTLRFENPAGVPFTYDAVIYGTMNKAPYFTSDPMVDSLGAGYVGVGSAGVNEVAGVEGVADRIEIRSGQVLSYELEGADPDGDALDGTEPFVVVSGPSGVVIAHDDQVEGDPYTLTWDTAGGGTPVEAGVYEVRLRVMDAFGLSDRANDQVFTVHVVAGANRPPLFTSVAPVEVEVNSAYVYDVGTLDPDGDAVAVTATVVGLTEGSGDGQYQFDGARLSWTPRADQVGDVVEVTLRAVDRLDGDPDQLFAEQHFSVVAVEEAGNHGPYIISEPVLLYELPKTPVETTDDVKVDGVVDQLLTLPGLAVGETTMRNVSLTALDSIVTPLVDVFLLMDDSDSYQDMLPELADEFYNVDAQSVESGIAVDVQGTYSDIPFGFGVGRFSDYMDWELYAESLIDTDGGFEHIDRPFMLSQPIVEAATTDSMDAIKSALERNNGYSHGGDTPESIIEALYQIATGAGLDGNNWGGSTQSGNAGSISNQLWPNTTGDVPAFSTYVAEGDELDAAGVFGGVGFRGNSLRIVVLATDGGLAYEPETHWDVNDPDFDPRRKLIQGVENVELVALETTHDPHLVDSTDPDKGIVEYFRRSTRLDGNGDSIGGAMLQETVDAMNALRIKVVGVGAVEGSTGFPSEPLKSLARLTGAVDSSGNPLYRETDNVTKNRSEEENSDFDPAEYAATVTDIGSSIGAIIKSQIYNAGYSIDLIATEPGVIVTNPEIRHNVTGLDANGVDTNGSSFTVDFDVTFTGDGHVHSFDLQFINPATGVVFGTLPVIIDALGYSYNVEALDPDGDVITYGLLGEDHGATIDPVTGDLDWAPTAVGFYTFTVEATDGRGGVDTQTYTVEVVDTQDGNDPPVVSIEDQEVMAGLEFALDVEVTGNADADGAGDSVQFFLVESPEGMSIDRFTGRLRWTPTAQQADGGYYGIGHIHDVLVKAVDSRGGFGYDDFKLTVIDPTLTNEAPRITSAAVTEVELGLRYDYQVTAVDDVPVGVSAGDEVRFDLVYGPEGMVMDGVSGQLVWEPSGEDVGEHEVYVRVMDTYGASDLQKYTLTVTSPDRAPVFTAVPDWVIYMGQATGTEFAVTAIDPDDPDGTGGAVVTYSLVGNAPGWDETPVNAMTIDVDSGQLIWTPAYGTYPYLDPYEVTVRATSEGLSSDVTFGVAVMDPNAGINANTALTILGTPREVISQNQTLLFVFGHDEAHDERVVFAMESGPSGMTIGGDGELRWEPGVGDVGLDHGYTIRATDGRGATTTATFSVRVVHEGVGNAAPVITSEPTFAATVGYAYRYQATAVDLEGDAMVWFLGAGPDGASIDVASGLLTWTPAAYERGVVEFAVVVVDANGGWSEQAFEVGTYANNQPPVIESTPVVKASPGSGYAYQVVGVDPDQRDLNYSLLGIAEGMATDPPGDMSIDVATGLIGWSPVAGDVGSGFGVTVKVDDGRGAWATQSFVVNVVENLKPVVTSAPQLVVFVGETYQYEMRVDDADSVSLSYAIETGPTGMTMTETAYGALVQWDAPVAGTAPVTLSVSDGVESSTQSFALEPRVNTAPVIDYPVAGDPVDLIAGEAWHVQVVAHDDDAGDRVSLSLGLDAPEGMEMDGHGQLSWLTKAGDVGLPREISIIATDLHGATDTRYVTLRVGEDTQAPEVAIHVSYNPVVAGQTVEFYVDARDNVAVESLVITINDVDINGLVDATALTTGNTFTYTPQTTGDLVVVATATDATGGVLGTTSSTATVHVVNPASVAPVIGIDSVVDGQVVTAPVDAHITIADSDNPVVQVSYRLVLISVETGHVTEIAAGDADDGTGAFLTNDLVGQIDPTILANGAYRLRLTATDKVTMVSAERRITIEGNLKLGNFALGFVDVSLPVAGVPIAVMRTYDSLNADRVGDFGYGWRMSYRESEIEISGTVVDDLLGKDPAFGNETEVRITLPGGQEELFYFQPRDESQLFGLIEQYSPAFVNADGVSGATLVAKKVGFVLERLDSGAYREAGTLDGYDPDKFHFGGGYYLTTRRGLTYDILPSGAIASVTDLYGNYLTLDQASISSYNAEGELIVDLQFERDSENRITRIVDPLGNEVNYTYDWRGDLVSVTDQEGYVTTFGYLEDPAHYLETITDHTGKTVAAMTYTDGRVTAVEDFENNSTTVVYDPVARTTTTTDALGRTQAVSTADVDGNVLEQRVTSLIDSLEAVYNFTYDSDGRMLSSRNPKGIVTTFEYDSETGLLSSVEAPHKGTANPDTYTSYFEYNDFGQRTMVLSPSGAVENYRYNAKGDLLSIANGDGHVLFANGYNEAGLITSETDNFGQTTLITYDHLGNPLTIIDPDGAVTTNTYNVIGQLEKTVSHDPGDPSDPTDPDFKGEEYDMTYDGLGRETFTDFKDGLTLSYTYSHLSDWNEVDSPTTGRIERRQDAAGRLTGWYNAKDDRSVEFVYNDNGELIKQITYDHDYEDVATRVHESSIRTTYDGLGRPASKTHVLLNPDGTDREELPSGSSEVDAAGRVTSRTDAAGNTTTYLYESGSGKLKSMTTPDGVYTFASTPTTTTVTDPLGRVTQTLLTPHGLTDLVILADGSMTSAEYLLPTDIEDATDYATSYTDRGGRERAFNYDTLGYLESVTDLSGTLYDISYAELADDHSSETITGPGGEAVVFEYDDEGNLVSMTYPDAAVKSFDYGDDFKLDSVTLPDGESIELAYFDSAVGDEDLVEERLLKNAVGATTDTTTYTYNDDGQMLTASNGVDATSGVEIKTTYTYDPDSGAVTSITFPDTSSVAYAYTDLGQLESVTAKASTAGTPYATGYSYYQNGRLSKVTDPLGGETTYSYDNGGRVSQRKLPNGVVTEYTYNDMDELLTITHYERELEEGDPGYDPAVADAEPTNNPMLARFEYTRRRDGAVEKVERLDGSWVEFTYDDDFRLASESHYQASGYLLDQRIYSYDASGNRTRVVRGATWENETYSYDAGTFQLTSVADDAAGTESYTYDANGRLDVMTRDGVTTDLEFDSLDQLNSASVTENSVTATTSYSYDAEGRRVKSVKGSDERRYVVAPTAGGLESPHLVSDENGNLVHGFVYAGYTPLFSFDDVGVAHYYLEDAMGSITGHVDEDGRVIERENVYDAFGNVLSQSDIGGEDWGAMGGAFRFQGQWLDSDTGLYHMRARYYDPDTGRFVSRDPVEATPKLSETLNGYLFANANPAVFSDPTGEFTIVEINFASFMSGVARNGRAVGIQQAKSFITNIVQEAAVNTLVDLISSYVPLNTASGMSKFFKSTGVYTNIGKGSAFGALIAESLGKMPFSRIFWFETPIDHDSGEVKKNGINGEEGNLFARVLATGGSGAKPDLLISDGNPEKNVPYGNALIAEFALRTNTFINKYMGNKAKQRSQKLALINHATNYTFVPVTALISLYPGKPGAVKKPHVIVMAKKLQKEFLKKGVFPVVVTIIG